MTATAGTLYHLTGAFLSLNVRETYNTLPGAKRRLRELAAQGNDISESDPYYRRDRRDRFGLTAAPIPELMDKYTGETLITIEEQQV